MLFGFCILVLSYSTKGFIKGRLKARSLSFKKVHEPNLQQGKSKNRNDCEYQCCELEQKNILFHGILLRGSPFFPAYDFIIERKRLKED